MYTDGNLTLYTRVRERWELTRRRVGDCLLVPFTNETRPGESPAAVTRSRRVEPTSVTLMAQEGPP